MGTRKGKHRKRYRRAAAESPASLAIRLSDGIRLRARPLSRLARAVITEESVEALHDLRVASRRLRSAAAIMEHTMPRRRVRPVARQLKHLTRTLGTTREIDVDIDLLQRLLSTAELADERAAIEHVLEKLGRRHEKAHDCMIAGLRRLHVARLRRAVTNLSRRIPPSNASDDARDADDILAPLIEHAFAGLPALRQSERPAQLHEMRIAVKRLRYAFEWLAPAAPGGFASLIQRATALQDCIGHHHDLFQLQETLTQMEPGLEERGRTALLTGLRRCREKVSIERQQAYARFLELTVNLTASAIHHKARVALGLGEKQVTIGILPRKVGG